MKKLISLALAALLLLNLAACGDGPAPSSSGSSGDVSSSAGSSQTDVLSPVTTEAEVRALYGDDADLIVSIEAYQGDFLVQLGTEDSCPSLDWVYGQSGIRRRMLWLDTPLLRCEIESQASVRVVTGGPNIYNGVPGFPRVELATLSLLYDEQGRDRGYDPYVSPGIGSSEIYWAGAGERYSMGMQGRREAIRSAQVDAGGLTVAFAPLADGSDFVAAYCEIPYTEVALSEDGMTLTVTSIASSVTTPLAPSGSPPAVVARIVKRPRISTTAAKMCTRRLRFLRTVLRRPLAMAVSVSIL